MKDPYVILIDIQRNLIEYCSSVDWFMVSGPNDYKDVVLFTHKDLCSIGFESEEYKPSNIALF